MCPWGRNKLYYIPSCVSDSKGDFSSHPVNENALIWKRDRPSCHDCSLSNTPACLVVSFCLYGILRFIFRKQCGFYSVVVVSEIDNTCHFAEPGGDSVVDFVCDIGHAEV